MAVGVFPRDAHNVSTDFRNVNSKISRFVIRKLDHAHRLDPVPVVIAALARVLEVHAPLSLVDV